MSAITKTVTVADVWANDDGGVSLELEGTIVDLSIVEAATYAAAVMDAAIEAAAGTDADAEQTIRELRERMAVLPEPTYDISLRRLSDCPEASSYGFTVPEDPRCQYCRNREENHDLRIRHDPSHPFTPIVPDPDSWGGRL